MASTMSHSGQNMRLLVGMLPIIETTSTLACNYCSPPVHLIKTK